MAIRMAVAGTLWLAVMAVAAWQGFRPSPRLWAALVGLAVLDLWAANRQVNATAPRDIFSHRPPLADVLPRDDASRVYVYRYPLRPAHPHRALATDNPYRIAWFPQGYDVHAGQILAARLYPMPPVGAAFGLRGSYDPDLLGLYPSGLAQLVDAMAASEGTPAYARFLRLGAVTHVVALHTRGFEDLVPERELHTPFELPVRVFGVKDALPRTYVVGHARLADGPEALKSVVDPAFDPIGRWCSHPARLSSQGATRRERAGSSCSAPTTSGSRRGSRVPATSCSSTPTIQAGGSRSTGSLPPCCGRMWPSAPSRSVRDGA